MRLAVARPNASTLLRFYAFTRLPRGGFAQYILRGGRKADKTQPPATRTEEAQELARKLDPPWAQTHNTDANRR